MSLFKRQVTEIIKVLKNNSHHTNIQCVYFPKFCKDETAKLVLTDGYILVHYDTGIKNTELSQKVITLEQLQQWKKNATAHDYLSEVWMLNNCHDPIGPYPDTSRFIIEDITLKETFDGSITIDAQKLMSVQKICDEPPHLYIKDSLLTVYFEKNDFEGVILPIRAYDYIGKKV